jgi:hypothetical protein
MVNGTASFLPKERVHNTIREFDIPWAGGSKYHG